MYVAAKGGERAIANAHALLTKEGRGDLDLPRIDFAAVAGQLGVLVSRVMTEGSLYDPGAGRARHRAGAGRRARGDYAGALVPHYAAALRLHAAADTAGLPPQRRISATFKDLPGGQQLGATFDYTHRLFTGRDASSSARRQKAPPYQAPEPTTPPEGAPSPSTPRGGPETGPGGALVPEMPRVTDLLGASALIEPDHVPGAGDPEPGDLTREPTIFPVTRAERLQALARADEGFLLGLAYSTQRGYGGTHPFAGEIRVGEAEAEFEAPELGFAVPLGRVELTECQMISQSKGSADTPARFTRGYGLAFGRSERKAMSMSMVDRALRAAESGDRIVAPAQDEEFVISHSDNVQATGFVEHLKLPHYVDFQAELGLVRQLNAEFQVRMEAKQEPVLDDLADLTEARA